MQWELVVADGRERWAGKAITGKFPGEHGGISQEKWRRAEGRVDCSRQHSVQAQGFGFKRAGG